MSRVTPFTTSFEVDEASLNAGAIYRKIDGSLWKIDENGDPQPLGGSGSQTVKRVLIPIAFDTVDLAAGIEIYTPAVGEILLDFAFIGTEAWDGVNPAFLDGGTQGAAIVNSSLSTQWSVLAGPNTVGSLVSSGAMFSLLAGFANAGQYGPYNQFSTVDPFEVWVSQNGSKGGDDPESATGAGIVVLEILTAS